MLPEVQALGSSRGLSTRPPGLTDLPSGAHTPGSSPPRALVLATHPAGMLSPSSSRLSHFTFWVLAASPPLEPLLTVLPTASPSIQAFPSTVPCFLFWVPPTTI